MKAAVRWATMLAGAVALAACGGRERQQQSAAGSDTAASAPSETSATTPPAETTTALRPDTSRQLPAVKESTAAPPEAGTAIARKSTPRAKPTARPAADTGVKRAPAAKPPQDTSAAKPTQDTAKAKPAQPAESAQTQTAQAPLRDAYHQPPLDTVSQEVYNGWKQFNLNCARCHGEDALGTTIAPHLILSLKPDGPINTKELFMQTVCAGRPEKGMPAWCALGLDMQKIADIYAYVKGRSDGKIHPGRPAVREQG